MGYMVKEEYVQTGEVRRQGPVLTDKIKCLWWSGTPC